MRGQLRWAMPVVLAGVALAVGDQAMAVEEPGYQIITRDQTFEVRLYQPVLVAEVEVDGDLEEAGSIGFRPLADYIFGNNIARSQIAMTAPVTQQAAAGEKIAMTAPVTQQAATGEKIAMTAPVTQQAAASGKIAMTAPVTQQGLGRRQIVRFTMPANYTLETLPTPRDPQVKLKRIEGATYAVVRYSGRWSNGNYQKHLAALQREITARGLVAAGPPIWARYDAPFTPWFMRRNEVMIPVQ